ncbi:unnamed protein product, partial [marine sediment metagenome]
DKYGNEVTIPGIVEHCWAYREFDNLPEVDPSAKVQKPAVRNVRTQPVELVSEKFGLRPEAQDVESELVALWEKEYRAYIRRIVEYAWKCQMFREGIQRQDFLAEIHQRLPILLEALRSDINGNKIYKEYIEQIEGAQVWGKPWPMRDYQAWLKEYLEWLIGYIEDVREKYGEGELLGRLLGIQAYYEWRIEAIDNLIDLLGEFATAKQDLLKGAESINKKGKAVERIRQDLIKDEKALLDQRRVFLLPTTGHFYQSISYPSLSASYGHLS